MSSSSSDVVEFWSPIQAALDVIWASISGANPRPITASFLSAVYSKIVSLSGRNFLAFFRTVYGDWDRGSALGSPAASGEAYQIGECARWAASRFSHSASIGAVAGSGAGGPGDLSSLAGLSKRVQLLQCICNALFSLTDKQRLDRGKMLYGGSAPSIGEIVEVVYWNTVVKTRQHQLFAYACDVLNRVRGGETCSDLESIWGTLRFFKASSSSGTALSSLPSSQGAVSPALYRLREERGRIYRSLVSGAYVDAMVRYYEGCASVRWASGGHGYAAWALRMLDREEEYAALARFPADLSASVVLAALRVLVVPFAQEVLYSETSSSSPRALIPRHAWGEMAEVWRLVRRFLSFNVQRHCIYEGRKRVDDVVAEQSSVSRLFSDALLAGATRACTAACADAATAPPSNVSAGVGISSGSLAAVDGLAALWSMFGAFAADHFGGYGVLVEQMRVSMRRVLSDAPPAQARPSDEGPASDGGGAFVGLPNPARAVAAAVDAVVSAPVSLQESEGTLARLDSIIALGALIPSLDAFGVEMRRLAAHRLLKRSDRASLDKEREVCSLLRNRSGCQSMSASLLAMIDDVGRGWELTKTYTQFTSVNKAPHHDHCAVDPAITQSKEDAGGNRVAVSVVVLKKVNWSAFVAAASYTNALLVAHQAAVARWYSTSVHLNAHVESLLEVTVSIVFAGSKRLVELTGSRHTVVEVLLAISKARRPPSVLEVADLLGVAPRVVGMAASFLRSRGVVCAVGRNAAINDRTLLCIDTSAAPRARKVCIDPPPSREEAVVTLGRASEELTQLRKHQLQIALVRVMKRRKDESVPHDMLVSEVMGLVAHSFCPTMASVKLQIEELIRKDIVERDDRVCGAYRYKM